MKYSPFFLEHGRHPRTGVQDVQVANESAEAFAKRMEEIRQKAKENLEKVAEEMKKHYDERKSPAREYKAGDKVLLEGTNIKTDRPMKKLDDKRYGPFEVEKKVGRGAYKLKLPKTWRNLHPTFNEYLLTPYKEPEFPTQQKESPPPPDIIDQVPEYEVEEVIDSRKRRGKLEYLVHWKGYPREERTWEPAANLANAEAARKEFHSKNPNAIRGVIFEVNRFQSRPMNPIPPNVIRPRLEDDPEIVTDPEEILSIIKDLKASERLAETDPMGIPKKTVEKPKSILHHSINPEEIEDLVWDQVDHGKWRHELKNIARTRF
jgi:hypothetical protein